MKKKDAMKWINALRSGKYKQTQGFLKDEAGYCCLGVLDEINPELNLAGGDDSQLDNYKKIGLRNEVGRLDRVFYKSRVRFGFWSISNRTMKKPVTLADLNDGLYEVMQKYGLEDGLNFDEIADVIQIEYVEGL